MKFQIQAYKEFYNDHIESALQECCRSGYRALSLPELAERYVQGLLPLQWYGTISLSITGIPSGEQEAITLYWHEPTPFVTPRGIIAAKRDLVKGAGHFDQKIFDKIYTSAAAQKPHLIIPCRKLRELPSTSLRLTTAERDPRIVACLNGQVESYLLAYAKLCNTNRIYVSHSNDRDKRTLARLLYLSNDGGFCSNNSLVDCGRFIGHYLALE